MQPGGGSLPRAPIMASRHYGLPGLRGGRQRRGATFEKVTEPARYYDVNVNGTRVLLDSMCATGVELLVLSSSCAVYGEPDSRGPSTRQDEETEFLYYAFDWAGSEVPQVLEVTCNQKTGRVVQITLAAQSL